MINKILIDTLKGAGIPVLYGLRGDTPPPCVVFHYYDEPFASSCDQEELTKCKILLNIYHDGDFTELVNKIKKLMNDNGFIKTMQQNAIYSDTIGAWNVPIEYIKIIESEMI